jgi:hypothetical protein
VVEFTRFGFKNRPKMPLNQPTDPKPRWEAPQDIESFSNFVLAPYQYDFIQNPFEIPIPIQTLIFACTGSEKNTQKDLRHFQSSEFV